jgi:Trypsin-like peptidase domain
MRYVARVTVHETGAKKSASRTAYAIAIFFTLCACLRTVAAAQANVASPEQGDTLTSVDTKLLLDAAGPEQRTSLKNVYLIGCKIDSGISFGSGFLLNDGVLITNAHVVNGCAGHTLLGVSTSNAQIAFSKTIIDPVRDLAILVPSVPLDGGYVLAVEDSPEPGTRVDTWGYPFGYNGTSPLLSVGYVAGYRNSLDNGGSVKHIVVNGAFNHGNSGGPLLVSQGSEVIGVVALTFHFYPPEVRTYIDALGKNQAGAVFTLHHHDGTTENIVDSQVTSMVLDEFYQKTQIDIGEAIAASELKQFLQEHVGELPFGMPKSVAPKAAKKRN